MSVLVKKMAAAAVAGTALFGASAMAQEDSAGIVNLPTLLLDQDLAVSLQREYNRCLDMVGSQPNYQAQVDEYNQQLEIHRQEFDGYFEKVWAWVAKNPEAVGTYDETLENAAEALGPRPAVPFHPLDKCQEEYDQAIAAEDKTYEDISSSLDAVWDQYGSTVFKALVTPKPKISAP